MSMPLPPEMWARVAAAIVRTGLDTQHPVSRTEAHRWLAALEDAAIHQATDQPTARTLRMDDRDIVIGTWAKIGDNCPISYTTNGSVIEFTLGGRRDGFDLLATRRGLHKLIDAGTEALEHCPEPPS